MNNEEDEIVTTLSGLYQYLLKNQVDLDADCVKVLNDNFWDLLVS